MNRVVSVVLLLLVLAVALPVVPKVSATTSQDLWSSYPVPDSVSREPMPEIFATEDYLNTTNPDSDLIGPEGAFEEVDEQEGDNPLYVLVFLDEEERSILRSLPQDEDYTFRDCIEYAQFQIERGDEALVSNFGIDIRILGFEDWDSDDDAVTLDELWWELKDETEQYLRTWYDGEWWDNCVDAVIGITGQETSKSGLAPSDELLDQGETFVMLRWMNYWKDDNLVQHEISHLYHAPDHPIGQCCAMAQHVHTVIGVIWEDAIWLVAEDVFCSYLTYSWCEYCTPIMLENKGRYPLRILSISAGIGGSTDPLPAPYLYANGCSVTVTALPDWLHIFGTWTLDNATYYDNPITITMNSNHVIRCNFISMGHDGGGCPYVSTWSGTGWVLDNNLIPAAERSNGSDVTDYYKIQQPLILQSGRYPVLIWDLDKHSFLDQVRLVAVDHRSNVNIGVSPYGEVLTYQNPAPPIMALNRSNGDVTNYVSMMDDNYVDGYAGDFLELDFGNIDVSSGAKLVLRTDPPCQVRPCDIKYSIHIQVLNLTGSWADVASFIPRIYWSIDVINLSSYLPDINGDLKVRLYFTAHHKIDYVGLDTTEQGDIEQTHATLAQATHSRLGDVKELFQQSDNLRVELLPGEQVTLQFTLPQNNKEKRDFIIILEGHYFIPS